MPKSTLCDYSDAYILVSGFITIDKLAAGRSNNNIQVVFKNCAPFTDCISEINNTQIDNAVVIPMYNLIEYSDNCSNRTESLWQYYRDKPALTDAGAADNFPGNDASFKFKQKITDRTDADGTKIVKIMVPLKY